MARIYVSIGSNIREPNIRTAVQALRKRFGTLALSSVYESQPIGFEGENFYNLVAAFGTDESPEVVTAVLNDIERQLGRRRGPSRFTSRTIDLDLLLYDDLIREQATLQLPRREIDEYACILRPLAEIAPGIRGVARAGLAVHFLQAERKRLEVNVRIRQPGQDEASA